MTESSTPSTNLPPTGIRAFRQKARRATKTFRPPPKLTVSEWADTYRRLSPESSAEPGRWQTDRAPYQRGIMDAVSDPAVSTVVVMSSAQVGKTELINNVVGFHIHQDPAPILVVQPTLEMGQAWSKDRLAPMLRDTPALKGSVKDPRARDSGNTLLHKTFPGGHLTIAGANSAAGLASRPIRVVLCDEVDRYPESAGSEGDPVALAFKRSATFWNRKRILTSTPTIAGASRIERAYLASDQRRYLVPCPHCGHEHALEWKHVDFNRDAEKRIAGPAFMVCPECGAAIEERQKLAMLRAGRWEATADPVEPGVAGFHLSELYSPWKTWSEVRDDFLAAQGSSEALQAWTNTSLGETWELEGEKLEASPLFLRREHYAAEVPDGVSIVTAAIDVQADRLEIGWVGWGEGEESWWLDYRRWYAEPTRPETWAGLDAQVFRQFRRADGSMVDVDLLAIDSGSWTDEVYSWCRRQASRVIPVKGASQRDKPVAEFPRTRNRAGLYLVPVGTDKAKNTIVSRLQQTDPGPGYMHFPRDRQDVDETFFEQLTAERRVKRRSYGQTYYAWDAGSRRNEVLDVAVYNLAALRVLVGYMGRSLAGSPAERPAPQKRARRARQISKGIR